MEAKKHYLVTGGAGFIGSSLVRRLLEDESIRVTCIDNFDPFYKRQIKLLHIDGFEKAHNFFLLDVNLDKVTVEELHKTFPEPIDVVIHLAARAGVRPSILDPEAYQTTNILGTQKLLHFAMQKKVKRFVFASSSSVYGVNENLPWKEDERLMPISPYAMTKLSGEQAGHVYSRIYGLPFIALRFFTVYGPAQRPDLAIHKFTKAILQNKPISVFGDGTTSRDYTYIDDIVKGVMAAIDYNQSNFEIINLGNNYTVTLNELVQQMEQLTGRKAIIDRKPEQPGDVPRTFADISKARRLLGYNPDTKLQDGLQAFYNWFKKHEAVLLLD